MLKVSAELNAVINLILRPLLYNIQLNYDLRMTSYKRGSLQTGKNIQFAQI